MNIFAKIGRRGLWVLADAGRMGLFFLRTLQGVIARPFRFREFIRQLHFIGVGSLVVVFSTAITTGMVLGLQGYYSLNKFGAESMLGSAVALTIIMELGPVLTALMVTGRAGSAMCAELGIMRITEQIDALDCMAIDPFRYFISPKFLAILISVPLLTFMFDVVGIVGGYLVGVSLMGVSVGSYIDGMSSSVTNHDIWLGFVKSVVFSVLIIWICAGRGYLVREIRGVGYGAESVSKVTTQAVVFSSIFILIFDYLITAILL